MAIERTVGELARIVGGDVLSGDPAARLCRGMPTAIADPRAVSFVSNPKYLSSLRTTRARAVMLTPEVFDRERSQVPAHVAVIGVARPYLAFALAAQAFAERVPAPNGIHTS